MSTFEEKCRDICVQMMSAQKNTHHRPLTSQHCEPSQTPSLHLMLGAEDLRIEAFEHLKPLHVLSQHSSGWQEAFLHVMPAAPTFSGSPSLHLKALHVAVVCSKTHMALACFLSLSAGLYCKESQFWCKQSDTLCFTLGSAF